MKGTTKALMAVAVGFALFLPLASASPDGLQRVTINLGVRSSYRPWLGLFSGYSLALTGNHYIDQLAAGLFGMAAVFAVAWFAGILISRRAAKHTPRTAPASP
jgi:hypothetical protein